MSYVCETCGKDIPRAIVHSPAAPIACPFCSAGIIKQRVSASNKAAELYQKLGQLSFDSQDLISAELLNLALAASDQIDNLNQYIVDIHASFPLENTMGVDGKLLYPVDKYNKVVAVLNNWVIARGG